MVEETMMNGIGIKPVKPLFVPPPVFTEMQIRAFGRGRGRMTRAIAPLKERAERKKEVDFFKDMEKKSK